MRVHFFRNLQTSYLTCRDRGILQTGYSLWPRSGCSYYNVATPNQRTLPIYDMRTRWAVLWVWALVTSISTLRAVFVCAFLLFCCCKFQQSYHNNECCNIKNNTLHNVYKFILHSMKFINSYVSKHLLTWLIFDFWCFNATFSNISAISWRPVLVVGEAGVLGENHRPWASNW